MTDLRCKRCNEASFVKNGLVRGVPVHGRETPICAYAAMGSWPI
jgi:hypothetical protein